MHIISISRVVAYWAEIQPDTVALVHENETLDWKTLEQTSNQLARAYQNLGVKPNDFVTIALPNGVEFIQACLAAWKLGATPQPVSAKLPKFELDQLIELAAPGLVVGIADGEYENTTSVAVGYTAGVIGDSDFSAEPLPEAVADSFKAMTSGGSTGRPKLIVSATPAMWDIDAEMLEIKQQGAMLIPGPMYHNGPFMWGMGALFKGNTVVVTTRFDAEQTLSLVEQYSIDVVYMVPTMMQRIWKLPTEIRTKYNMSSLRALWHLASPCPEWLKENFIEWLGPDVIWELYAGTEGIGSTVINGAEWLEHKGSVGKPTETCEMKIVGENGETLAPNEIGEVYMRPATGPGSTYRYVGADAKMLGDGWESLGDLGRLDEDGYLYLADRNTDMILSGGANIYPAEIEAAIDGYGPVRSSAVIGLPDEDMGNMVHAIVDAPGGITEQELLDYLSDRLVRYKIPRTIEFVSAPLRDDAGKSRRKQLRADRLK